jgi:putative transposase
MKARYQYRIYPTPQQQTDLAKLFGCCRVVWNDALALCKASGGYLKANELQKICITQAKKTDDREWLSEVSNIPLQQSIQDLGVAFKNFFESRSGKRKGPKVRYPRFKRKSNRQSARFRKGGFSIRENGKVYLAKIGELKVRWSRDLPSEPSSVTVIKDREGHYFLSFVVEVEPIQVDADNQGIGVDLGLKTFATLSTEEKIDAPKYNRLDRKIRREQRRLSRQQKGSKRRERTRRRIAKLTKKVRNIRKDFLHKLSTRLVRENSVVCLEDLNVSGMVKNRTLSRAISEAGWREFRSMCEAKSILIEDRQVQVISRWEPTSQVCSDCGYRWGKLDLSVREVVCLNCGTVQDRDGNASRNIKQLGLEQAHNSKWTRSECKTPLGAVCDEASTQQKAG